MKIETTDAPRKSDVDLILAGLNEYNYSLAPRDWRELAVILRDDDDDVVLAGACGASVWDWVHLKLLWVHADHRHAGLGTQVMELVEEEAVRRGCLGIHLDTYSFQALPFYQKIGFEIFGQLEEHPEGHQRFYLKKLIAPDRDEALPLTTIPNQSRH